MKAISFATSARGADRNGGEEETPWPVFSCLAERESGLMPRSRLLHLAALRVAFASIAAATCIELTTFDEHDMLGVRSIHGEGTPDTRDHGPSGCAGTEFASVSEQEAQERGRIHCFAQ